jgi:prophage regulatory protein
MKTTKVDSASRQDLPSGPLAINSLDQYRPLRVLRLPDVEKRVGLARSRIYALEAEGRFPKRVKLSERASGWVEHEIDEYLQTRVDARPATTPAAKPSDKISAPVKSNGKIERHGSQVAPLDARTVAEQLAVALRNPNPAVFFDLVGNVVKARGMHALAASVGISPRELAATFAPNAKPSYALVSKLLVALGFQIDVGLAETRGATSSPKYQKADREHRSA